MNTINTVVIGTSEKVSNTPILTLIEIFVIEAENQGIPAAFSLKKKYGVDPNIFSWFPNAQISDGIVPESTIIMLDEDLDTEGGMSKRAVRFPLDQAIQRMIDEIRAGYFNKNEKYLDIFLSDVFPKSLADKKMLKKDVDVLLVCRRFNKKLYLYVTAFGYGSAWNGNSEADVGFLGKAVG